MSGQLQQAITLIKAGHRQQGRQLLVDLLKTNPQSGLDYFSSLEYYYGHCCAYIDFAKKGSNKPLLNWSGFELRNWN